MTGVVYLPHIEQILQSLRVSRKRLASRSKVAIDTRVLRALLSTLVAQMPFDPEFYLAENQDIRAAYEAGQITDLHQHYINAGYLEGRFGAAPPVDEAFYAATYKDIIPAIRRGDIVSGSDHYVRSGAAEGRIPGEALLPQIERWAVALAD